MKKSRIDRSVIRCGNAKDADLAYMAMFRYAFGHSMTYISGVAIDIIKANGERLTDKCLALLDRDLTEEAARYERAWKGETITNYGMERDRELWLAFHAWVKEQIAKREESNNGK